MTYTQLKIEQCPPLDVLLSGKGYFPELDGSMRQWFTDGLQKGLSTPEERAARHTLGGGCSAGIELCTPDSEYQLYIMLYSGSSRVYFTLDVRFPAFGAHMLPAHAACAYIDRSAMALRIGKI